MHVRKNLVWGLGFRWVIWGKVKEAGSPREQGNSTTGHDNKSYLYERQSKAIMDKASAVTPVG